MFLFIVSRGLFASNYTETHYLDDGSVVTGSHNFMVGFLVFSVIAISGTINSAMFSALAPTQQLPELFFLSGSVKK